MMELAKYVATGNDFVFIREQAAVLAEAKFKISRAELAKRLCDRHFGVGADGLVIVRGAEGAESDHQQRQWSWDFYNSDGSTAEMCGNASRCMARWLLNNYGLQNGRFLAAPGPVAYVNEPERVVVRLDYIDTTMRAVAVIAAGRKCSAQLLNTGVPHAVLIVDSLEPYSAHAAIVQVLRHLPEAGANGANVTLLEPPIAGETWKTVTFERGVEGFTLSCGTGVLAAAAVGLSLTGGTEAWLRTPGGELSVEFSSAGRGARLMGEAHLVFEGRWSNGDIT
jgi:diaminopimelate epimerase